MVGFHGTDEMEYALGPPRQLQHGLGVSKLAGVVLQRSLISRWYSTFVVENKGPKPPVSQMVVGANIGIVSMAATSQVSATAR